MTLHEGELSIREGRLTCDIAVEAGAVLRNDAEVYTHAAVSSGEIRGRGTLWTHVSSKPIGGAVESSQRIIYWPVEAAAKFVLPVWHGNLFSIQKQSGQGELT